MGKIDFDPTLYAPNAPRVSVPRIRYTDVEAKAYNNLARSLGKGLVEIDAYFKKDKSEQFGTDMIAGEAMLNELEAKRKAEIESLPVEGGVNYEFETQKINKKYNDEWENWSKKNIRNLDNEDVAKMRNIASEKFRYKGEEHAGIYGIEYDKKRNVNNIELTEGLAIKTLDKNPYDQVAAESLYRSQYARTELGLQTEAEESENRYTIKKRLDQKKDAITTTKIRNAIHDGDYETADNLVSDGYSEFVTDEDKERIRNTEFASATYNREAGRVSEASSVEEYEALQAQIENDPYMSESHKLVLTNRTKAGVSNIYKSEATNYKSYLSSAKRGDLDFDSLATAEDYKGTRRGIGDYDQDLLIKTHSLALAEDVIKEDESNYKTAIKTNDDISDINDELVKLSITGDMSQDVLVSYIGNGEEAGSIDEAVKDGDISESVGRQMKRVAIDAFTLSLDENAMIERDTWYQWKDDIKMDEKATPYIRRLNKEIKEFDKVTGDITKISTDGLGEWYQEATEMIYDAVEQGKSDEEIESVMKLINDHIRSEQSNHYLRY